MMVLDNFQKAKILTKTKSDWDKTQKKTMDSTWESNATLKYAVGSFWGVGTIVSVVVCIARRKSLLARRPRSDPIPSSSKLTI